MDNKSRFVFDKTKNQIKDMKKKDMENYIMQGIALYEKLLDELNNNPGAADDDKRRELIDRAKEYMGRYELMKKQEG
ncbi:MAG: hypothetical protein LBR45_01260 [Bacteroidales bacterium]|jgi:hypothetical protein|nr:hypothetical protein [Bacteroidales bacterium]